MICRRWMGVALVVAGSAVAPELVAAQSMVGGGRCGVEGGHADLSQAFLMLDFLDRRVDGREPELLLDDILDAPGTGLVIRQMNLARRVFPGQYRQMLEGFVEGVEADIPPADTTRRAMAGVAGLGDAYARLTWAAENVDALRAHLETLRGLDIAENACATAFANLPRAVDVNLSASVVIGGRAGAAALSPASIYVDLAVMDLSAERSGEARMSDQRILDFFAHEIHHIAMRRVLDAEGAGADLSGPELYAFRILTELILEGSATYLIDFSRDLEAHRQDRGFADEYAEAGALLGDFERALTRVFSEDVRTDAAFDEITAGLVGNRYHAAGALLLAEIDGALGREAVMNAMRDPRLLMSTYVKATAGTEQGGKPSVDPELAVRLARMGSGPG